ncbi:hypothetical protein AB5I41_19720 [Sphingomonas sp. MMS24-JH45]
MQERRLFPDGKTFVDATAKRPAADILRDWRAGDYADDAGLHTFVLARISTCPVPAPRRGPVPSGCRWRNTSALARPDPALPLSPAAGIDRAGAAAALCRYRRALCADVVVGTAISRCWA